MDRERAAKLRKTRFGTELGYIVDEQGCHVWLGGVSSCGYPNASGTGKQQSQHRMAYEHEYGPIPEGLVIDHLCRNRRCINPAHMEAVTQQINVQRSSSSKLSASQVEDIRLLAENGVPRRQLRMDYNISKSHLSAIINRKAWSNIV